MLYAAVTQTLNNMGAG